ncbi:heat shock 70 kDa protein 12A-like [Ylistrum balloti]|uniref:heat shock 70 kDa protein 12A-like n=1 Tax=Ylistrum balloti TaxID=509963 RepID=UPI002905A6FC|nr:heat shock 70 kDa protein 12A-like [Ylistrum balloti]
MDNVDIWQLEVLKTCHPAQPDKTAVVFIVYSSVKRNPKYVNDSGWTKIRQLRIAFPDMLKGVKRNLTMQPPCHLLVAAIDFGTTYSGYAFSTIADYARDPLVISTPNWTAESGGLVSTKTSTCILFKPNGNFHSFGFEAEDNYSNLALDGDEKGWYFFSRFKMKIGGNKQLKRSFEIEDDQGRTMPAIKVFAAAIKYLKDHLMTSLNNKLTDVKLSDISWVLTVPAIWSNASKQFMREAAIVAGIRGDHLKIALEPEAASLFCKHLPMERTGEGKLKTFTSGFKYLVLDAGGGTIDIAVHEVQSDGSLNEIHKACGGDWGGTKVDYAFKLLLTGIIGNKAFHFFQEKNKADMIALFRDFELKKRNIKPNALSSAKVTFRLPKALDDACKHENNVDIAAIVESKLRFREYTSINADKLRISGNRANELFKDSINHVVSHLKKLLKEPNMSEMNSILMVGGYSESPVLQNEIRTNFPNIRVIVPQEAGLAVLKGAVIFGHEPTSIRARVCQFTYGVKTTLPFDSGKHANCKRFTSSTGEMRCRDIFDIHVSYGDRVNIGEPQAVNSYRPVEPDQTTLSFEVYNSIHKNPKYVTDAGCTKIGHLTITMPDTSKGLDRSVMVQMTFGNTELEVDATDKYTGEKVTAAFDFL